MVKYSSIDEIRSIQMSFDSMSNAIKSFRKFTPEHVVRDLLTYRNEAMLGVQGRGILLLLSLLNLVSLLNSLSRLSLLNLVSLLISSHLPSSLLNLVSQTQNQTKSRRLASRT
jgi:hypothetical protein